MARMEQLFEFCLGPNLGLRSTSSFEDFLDHMALKTHRLGGVLRRGSFGAPSAAPVQTSSPPNVAHGSFLSLRFLFPGWVLDSAGAYVGGCFAAMLFPICIVARKEGRNTRTVHLEGRSPKSAESVGSGKPMAAHGSPVGGTWL